MIALLFAAKAAPTIQLWLVGTPSGAKTLEWFAAEAAPTILRGTL